MSPVVVARSETQPTSGTMSQLLASIAKGAAAIEQDVIAEHKKDLDYWRGRAEELEAELAAVRGTQSGNGSQSRDLVLARERQAADDEPAVFEVSRVCFQSSSLRAVLLSS